MADAAAAPASTGAETQETASTEPAERKEGESSTQETGGQTPPPKKKTPQYRKYKIGDEEVSLSDEDIARDYAKWKGADNKFREAHAAKQSVEQFMKSLAEDPERVLSDGRLPIDRRKLAEKWLREQIEQELTPADPRDTKLKTLEEKLKGYEEAAEKDKQAKAEEARQGRVKESMSRIGETLKKAGELTHLSAHPESEAELIREMALYMRAARENDAEVTAEQVVEHIHNQRFRQFYTLANSLEGEELIEFLGEAVVKKMRQADLARLRAAREPAQQHRNDEPTTRTEKPKRMDPLSWRQHANKMLGVK